MLDAREFTLANLAKADIFEELDSCGLELAFAINDYGYDEGDRSVGEYPCFWAEVECIGGRLTYMGEIALTRAQVAELVGADKLAEIEADTAARYAETMEHE